MIRTGKARERFVSRMCPLCSTDECSGVELQRTVWGGVSEGVVFTEDNCQGRRG